MPNIRLYDHYRQTSLQDRGVTFALDYSEKNFEARKLRACVDLTLPDRKSRVSEIDRKPCEICNDTGMVPAKNPMPFAEFVLCECVAKPLYENLSDFYIDDTPN